MRLGEILRKWRIMSQLTVREVAVQIGILPSTYCRIENGKAMDGRTLAEVMTWMTEETKETANENPR